MWVAVFDNEHAIKAFLCESEELVEEIRLAIAREYWHEYANDILDPPDDPEECATEFYDNYPNFFHSEKAELLTAVPTDLGCFPT